MTLILVTHNPEIAKMADRVVVLKKGKIDSLTVIKTPCSVDMLEW